MIRNAGTFRHATVGFLIFGAAIGAGFAWQAGRGEIAGRAVVPPAAGDHNAARDRALSGRLVQLEVPFEALEEPDAARLLAALDRRVERMAATLGVSPGDSPILIRYHVDFESKARLTGNARDEHAEASAGPGGTVHRVLDLNHLEGDGIAEASLLLSRAWGETGAPWLSAGASVWLADRWLGLPLDDWPPRLAAMEQWPTPEDLLARFESVSYFFTWPAAGAYVRNLAATQGVKAVEALYRGSRTAAGPAGFEPSTLAFSLTGPSEQGMPRRSTSETGTVADGSGSAPGTDGFLRGVCYAHHHSSGKGYLSAAGAAHLAYLRDSVHVGAVSVSPFGYIKSAVSPRIHHPYRERGRADEDEETDESLIEVSRQAHDLGLAVLLAPHLWGRGVWCGEWHAEDEAGWEQLFDEYGRFLLHYAALAEYLGADALQIGKELGGTTHRDSDWRDLIRQVRKVYRGPIVYGANWDGEYARITWWDAVDYIGVSQYTPLSSRESPSALDLVTGAGIVADSLDGLARRFRRPYLLTEVGFTGARTAAREPWKSFDRETGQPDLALQARCYDAVLQVFSARTGCAGLFWWKWFSNPEANFSERNRYDFPPRGKPAEEVLARWYETLKESRSRNTPAGNGSGTGG